MTASIWLGIVSALALIGFIVFAFRQGLKAKPDKDRKTEDWPRITLGGHGS
jgi:hypothetical protein